MTLRKTVRRFATIQRKQRFMKLDLIVIGCACLYPVACESAEGPAETRSVSHMENRTSQADRDPGIFGDYWWANRFLSRHAQIEAWRGKEIDVVMLGDSIMHFWEWKHPASWGRFVQGKKRVLNLGYGGDTTQNVIWRIEHGELDGYRAKNIVLMIGTNNNSSKTSNPTNVALGVERIVSLVREKQPQARLVLHPIFPRGVSAESEFHAAARRRNDITNRLLKELAEKDGKIVWVDFSSRILDGNGWVSRELMADEIHPTDRCYSMWMDELEKALEP